MRLRIAAVVVALAAVLVTSASATSQKAVKLKTGDVVGVTGTHIACIAATSSGKRGIACLLLANGKPVANSYGALLLVDGTAVVSKLKANGSSQDLFARKPQSATRSTTVYAVKPNDVFGFVISSKLQIGCKVLNVTAKSTPATYRGVRVTCWRATAASKPVGRSYFTSISDKFVVVAQFDAKGNVTSSAPLVNKSQP